MLAISLVSKPVLAAYPGGQVRPDCSVNMATEALTVRQWSIDCDGEQHVQEWEGHMATQHAGQGSWDQTDLSCPFWEPETSLPRMLRSHMSLPFLDVLFTITLYESSASSQSLPCRK